MRQTEKAELRIGQEADIVAVRRAVRRAAEEAGLGAIDVTRIVTAASELARNVYQYTEGGEMSCQVVPRNGREALEIIFADQGPGIEDVERAMEPGYSTGNNLGLGLPGAKKLMDEMEIDSQVDRGTTVVIRKRLPD
jgi:serine/threonine-protein kinase RsbT